MPEGGAILDHRLLGGAIRLWVGYDDSPDGGVGRWPSPAPTWPTAWSRSTGWPPSPPSGDGAAAPPSPAGPCRVAPDLPAVLVASDDGRPVYERLGFLPIHRCTVWFRPGMTEPRPSPVL